MSIDTGQPSPHVNTSMGALLRYLPLLGRLLIAAIFLISGIGKLAAPQATQSYIVSAGLPAPALAYLLAVLIEIGGGALLVLGYRTRAVALVLALFALVTALSFHADYADPNQMNHFLKNVAIVGGLLYVVTFGAGSFSLDSRSGRANLTL